jgi:hypothetical protein
LAYATELGLDANEVLTDIRLWDEKNGNRASYNSVTAFWQGWCRKESKRRPARSVSQQKPNYAERGLSEAQLGFIDSLTRKYYAKFKHESYDWDMLHGWITEMVLNRYDFNQWCAMGHGLPHHTEL